MLTLHCHPTTPCSAVHSLQVAVERTTNGDLCLQYALRGELAHLRIPSLQAPLATDGLWEHTCFETFIGVQGDSSYHEFNFSPSSQWAAYAFSGYRERRKSSPSPSFYKGGELNRDFDENCEMPSCLPLCKRGIEGDFLLQALIPATTLPANPARKPLQLGLTAVIETVTGEKSYWALKHPTEKPDFHHRHGFTHEIWP